MGVHTVGSIHSLCLCYHVHCSHVPIVIVLRWLITESSTSGPRHFDSVIVQYLFHGRCFVVEVDDFVFNPICLSMWFYNRILYLWSFSLFHSRPLTIHPGCWSLSRNLYVSSPTSSIHSGWWDVLFMSLFSGKVSSPVSSLSRSPLNVALMQPLSICSFYLLTKLAYSKLSLGFFSSSSSWSYGIPLPQHTYTHTTSSAKNMNWGRDIGPSVSDNMGT